MKIHVTAEQIRQWEIESQEPEGDLTDVTVSDRDICQGEGCYNGFANIHAHLTVRWSNGAKRRWPIVSEPAEQRAWLIEHEPSLLSDWETGEGWAR